MATMFLFDLLLPVGLTTTALVGYLIFFRKSPVKKGPYRSPGWNYPLKLLGARWAVRRWKSQRKSKQDLDDYPRSINTSEGLDSIAFKLSAPEGPSIYLGMRRFLGRRSLAELTLHVRLSDGCTYKLPQHPDTAIGAWDSPDGGWAAGGLKIQVVEDNVRIRIIYNGLVTKVGENTTHHAKLNAIWTSVASKVWYPEDWSNELAAETLALESWRDGNWPNMLDKCEDSSWVQWGAIQGRFEVFTQGEVSTSEFLRVRGVKERIWSPRTYRGLRRVVNIAVAARDGTGVHLKAFGYKNVLTQCYSGCVRFPDFAVGSITSTDLVMTDFCEDPDGIPKTYVINVRAKKRDLKVVLRINSDGGKLLSGVPYQHETVYRTILVEIDGEPGTGLLELGYECTEPREPLYQLKPARTLQWARASEVGAVTYCASFESRVAACPDHVGGKGASLALLASVQKEGGYKVPPGFCVTTKALEKHLEMNPKLKKAILEIEAAAENYDEAHFKETCTRTLELISETGITGDVKEEILQQLNDLNLKAVEQGLGPEVRFAVRSSAVGEDSEALSAAGQNETVLGCTADDVLRGVQRCWGSMFAFISAHYRRQNGQQCLCGGGVVVQAMVRPRSAGVMFTRHPAHGDPTRLLITANYGLGESVVSGTVEPDSIEISLSPSGLSIASITVGSKAQRVSAGVAGVATEAVAAAERGVPCVAEREALRLARCGAAQEHQWAAPRDIEWALCGDDIYLLQARPITALERWTEEELLHELDFPIMSDDELLSFANIGEVLPKPISPLGFDLIQRPLQIGIKDMLGSSPDGYDHTIIVSHMRCVLSLYNSIYRNVSHEIDVGMRMVEMAIHGRKVADDRIFSVAVHRRQPQWANKIQMISSMLMSILTSKWKMNDTIKQVDRLRIDSLESDSPSVYLEALLGQQANLKRFSCNHIGTTVASSGSQFIAMTVLLEGGQDFSTEQCNEISAILSSGDVLSAEIPQSLTRLARRLAASEQAEQFRAQPPAAALAWLRRRLPELYHDVMAFLDTHGHRCIMEFDVAVKPWAIEPDSLMEVLQSMRPAAEEAARHAKTDKEIIAGLKTPKKSSTRKILRWLLPLCRRTVRHREGTKAHLILAIHKMRLVVRRLGRLLVKQWYLPHADLVFYFCTHELQDYIATRNPEILKKATQRYQYFPQWARLKFVEINIGWLDPIPAAGPKLLAGDARIEATSVCSGETVARACVVKELSEVGQLQQGDILITHSTDIGWSPYFPLVTGIVTELGGLISHGAVIAREYGLPCIVGAANATDIFKTGDLVRLSGTLGVLEKVEVAPTENGDK